MKRPKVIAVANLPAKLPFGTIILFFMAKSIWRIEGVWLGILATCVGIISLAMIISFFRQESIDILKDKE